MLAGMESGPVTTPRSGGAGSAASEPPGGGDGPPGPRPRARVERLGLWLGPLVAVLILLLADLDPARPAVTRMAAVAAWMAIWWITETVHLGVTALLPVFLLPLLQIMPGREVSGHYFNSIIFLFLGGFVVALAMERWGLHRRIALGIILLIGGGPARVLLGFMAATGFLSMWISNTACAMMMAPIAIAVIRRLSEGRPPEEAQRFAAALLLGVAYAASIGGMATLVGTPPNPMMVQNLRLLFPAAPTIGFGQWFLFGAPLSLVFLAAAWGLLALMFRIGRLRVGVDAGEFRRERQSLGPMSFEERIVLAAFVLLAVLWLTREGLSLGATRLPGWADLWPEPSFVDDGTVAALVALLLFVAPARRTEPGRRPRIMDWRTARRLPWGIVLLFGGGFALAAGFVESGLSAWLGDHLRGLSGLPPLLIVVSICVLITFLSELTSNTATAQMALPVVAALAVAIEVHPLLLMVPATLAASCGFMLPVATPPNAIVFSTEQVRAGQMARAGLALDLIGVVLVTAVVYLLAGPVLGIEPGVLPAWARAAGG